MAGWTRNFALSCWSAPPGIRPPAYRCDPTTRWRSGKRSWPPVDRDNTTRLREIVGRHGWPGRRLAGGDPQLYGTQYRVMDGVLELWAVRDPAGLDERRAALGLEPEAENRARLLAARGPAGGRPDDEPTGDRVDDHTADG